MLCRLKRLSTMATSDADGPPTGPGSMQSATAVQWEVPFIGGTAATFLRPGAQPTVAGEAQIWQLMRQQPCFLVKPSSAGQLTAINPS